MSRSPRVIVVAPCEQFFTAALMCILRNVFGDRVVRCATMSEAKLQIGLYGASVVFTRFFLTEDQNGAALKTWLNQAHPEIPVIFYGLCLPSGELGPQNLNLMTAAESLHLRLGRCGIQLSESVPESLLL